MQRIIHHPYRIFESLVLSKCCSKADYAHDGTLGTCPRFSRQLYHLKERQSFSASQVCLLYISSKTGYTAANEQVRTFSESRDIFS